MMEITAAVLRELGRPLSLETLEIESPRPDEVLVRVVGAGVCHTDLGLAHGDVPAELPLVLGHEGSGVVQQVGNAVTHLEPGDRVVLTYNYCGACANCRSGRSVHCADFLGLNFGGARPDGSTSLRRNDEVIRSHFFGQSSFATYALANSRNAVKVPDDAPLELLGPLGCGIQTGAGTVMNTLRPRPGASIAIFASGSVGLSALLGAVALNCAPIIAIDLKSERLDKARELGATHVVNASTDDPVAAIRDITGGGARFSVDAIGIPSVVRQALECLSSPGVCATVGFQGLENSVTFNQGHLLFGRTLIGVIEGDSVPSEFIPRMIELNRRGIFPFEKLIDAFPFSEINEAAAAAHEGSVIKPVLRMS